jgi:hypothetical protein
MLAKTSSSQIPFTDAGALPLPSLWDVVVTWYIFLIVMISGSY